MGKNRHETKRYMPREKNIPPGIFWLLATRTFLNRPVKTRPCAEKWRNTHSSSVLMCTYRTQSPVIHMRWNALKYFHLEQEKKEKKKKAMNRIRRKEGRWFQLCLSRCENLSAGAPLYESLWILCWLGPHIVSLSRLFFYNSADSLRTPPQQQCTYIHIVEHAV